MVRLYRVAFFSFANDAINHTGRWMCHTREQHILYISTSHEFPPLPLTLLPSLQQEYLQAALQDNGAQLPRAKSPVALTNVVSTEQETLCSHIRVKYLLFISAKAKRGDKECNNRESRIDRDGGSEL